MHKPSVKKVLKVLLRKSKGLNRVERIEEMEKGLTALGLVVCRQKRDNGISFVSYETIIIIIVISINIIMIININIIMIRTYDRYVKILTGGMLRQCNKRDIVKSLTFFVSNN